MGRPEIVRGQIRNQLKIQTIFVSRNLWKFRDRRKNRERLEREKNYVRRIQFHSIQDSSVCTVFVCIYILIIIKMIMKESIAWMDKLLFKEERILLKRYSWGFLALNGYCNDDVMCGQQLLLEQLLLRVLLGGGR